MTVYIWKHVLVPIWYFNDENVSIDLIIGSPYDPFLFQKPREVWDRTRTSLIFCFLAEGAYITVTLQLPYSYQLVQQIMSIYSMRLQLGSTELHVHRSIKWKCILPKKCIIYQYVQLCEMLFKVLRLALFPL